MSHVVRPAITAEVQAQKVCTRACACQRGAAQRSANEAMGEEVRLLLTQIEPGVADARLGHGGGEGAGAGAGAVMKERWKASRSRLVRARCVV